MLTDTKLRSLKPKATAYRVADTNGLCIEVRHTGAKVWRYRYRHVGKASMTTIGEYPQMTLADARAARDKARALLSGGANPSQVARVERLAKVERAGNTFEAVATELLAKRAKEGLGPGSVKRERRLIEKDLGPYVGSLPVADVTAPLLLAALRKIEQRGAQETAHRARALAGLVFRYAIATGRTERNPAADLAGALASPTVQHFAAVTEPDKVGDLLRATHGYLGTPVVATALKLAPLVFVRPGELRSARWADIDLDSGEWRFTATKTNTPHIVPLSEQAHRDTGPTYYRADGQIQTATGEVQNINRQALFLGTTAALSNGFAAPSPGTGYPQLNGLSAVLRISDAIFEPMAARRVANAQDAALQATANDTLLSVTEAYFNLQLAAGTLAIAREAAGNAEALTSITAAYAQTGSASKPTTAVPRLNFAAAAARFRGQRGS